MVITDFLSRSNVLELAARDKGGVLDSLARHAARVLGIDPGPLLDALLKREALGSTGMGGGMAMPHAYIPGVDAPIGVLARLETPVDFDAVDGRPVDIVFLLLLSASRDTVPLNAMACAARRLRHPDVVSAIVAASNIEELYDAIRGGETQASTSL